MCKFLEVVFEILVTDTQITNFGDFNKEKIQEEKRIFWAGIGGTLSYDPTLYEL
jgi:hypothetical protein